MQREQGEQLRCLGVTSPDGAADPPCPIRTLKSALRTPALVISQFGNLEPQTANLKRDIEMPSDPPRGAPLHREPGDFARVFQVQLLFNMSPMSFHCLGTEMERFGDRFDFFALADALQYLQLAIG